MFYLAAPCAQLGAWNLQGSNNQWGNEDQGRLQDQGFLWDARNSLDPPLPQDGQQPALQALGLLQDTHDQARLLRLLPVPPAALLPLG